MDAELLKTVGQIAGIGGLALGTFLILFRELLRKSIFPTLKKDDAYRLLRLITVLTWSLAVVGIGAWVWIETWPGVSSSAQAVTGVANTGEMTIGGDLEIGAGPPQTKNE